jgi:hypothetical protein
VVDQSTVEGALNSRLAFRPTAVFAASRANFERVKALATDPETERVASPSSASSKFRFRVLVTGRKPWSDISTIVVPSPATR